MRTGASTVLHTEWRKNARGHRGDNQGRACKCPCRAITVGNTGNILQAGFSYGSNVAIKQTTGKTPEEHVTSYIEEKKEKKKIRKEIVSYLETHIEIMRKKLSIKK